VLAESLASLLKLLQLLLLAEFLSRPVNVLSPDVVRDCVLAVTVILDLADLAVVIHTFTLEILSVGTEASVALLGRLRGRRAVDLSLLRSHIIILMLERRSGRVKGLSITSRGSGSRSRSSRQSREFQTFGGASSRGTLWLLRSRVGRVAATDKKILRLTVILGLATKVENLTVGHLGGVVLRLTVVLVLAAKVQRSVIGHGVGSVVDDSCVGCKKSEYRRDAVEM